MSGSDKRWNYAKAGRYHPNRFYYTLSTNIELYDYSPTNKKHRHSVFLYIRKTE